MVRAVYILIVLIFVVVSNRATNHAQDSEEIVVDRDIPYLTPLAENAAERLLDVYASSTSGDFPTVVILHGGSGSKDSYGYPEISQKIAELGAVVFTANISQENGAILFREDEYGSGVRRFLEEGMCAIQFARVQSADYGGNGEDVIVFGHSGGGYVALWLSLVGKDASNVWNEFASQHGGPEQQVECLATELDFVSPSAMIGFAGAYVFFDQEQFVEANPALQGLISPATYIANNPDVILRFIFGRTDRTMPDFAVEWTRKYYNDLADAGHNITWTVVESSHNFPVTSPANAPVMAVIGEVVNSLKAQE